LYIVANPRTHPPPWADLISRAFVQRAEEGPDEKIPNRKGEMKMKVKKKVAILLVLVFLIGILSIALPIAPVSATPVDPDWSVQYMIDTTQTVLGKHQWATGPPDWAWGGPRSTRGLALSPGGEYLYAGYNNPNLLQPSAYHGHEVRKIRISAVPDWTMDTVTMREGNRGKAIATDDKGRVYLAEGSGAAWNPDGAGIHIYDASLATWLYTIGLSGTGLAVPEGVAVTREGIQLVLYVTDRTAKSLTRFEITEGSGVSIVDVNRAGLGGTGVMSITDAVNLRGVEVDPAGRIWMADISAKKVFRVNSDGSGLTWVSVDKTPIDIGFSENLAFVTHYEERIITVLKQDEAMTYVETLTPPWVDLGLDITTGGSYGPPALSGIAVTFEYPTPTKRQLVFYVTNEEGHDASRSKFEPILKCVYKTQYLVSFAVSPSGSGTTTPSATAWYDARATIDPISATANPGYTFSSWSTSTTSIVIASPSSESTTATIDGAGTITATFTQIEYTLTVTVVGSGTVTKTPDDPTYHYGDSVTLQATPAAGWSFTGWSGGLSGNPVEVTINDNMAVTATFIGPKTIKQGVLEELIALRNDGTVTDKGDLQKLDEAIKHLTKSLDTDLWLDETHLDPKHGDKVFNEEKDAVVKLVELLKDKKSTLTDAQRAIVQSFIGRLVGADKALATVAYNDAVAAGGDAKKIDKANDELSKGDARVSDNHFADAIEHYRNAWKHAIKAV